MYSNNLFFGYCTILNLTTFFFSTGNDEFADFSLAFTQPMSVNVNPTNLSKFFH